MSIEEILDRLHGVHSSGGQFSARCPAHDDREASLSLKEGEDGIVLNCFAGCDTRDVIRALDITFDDLFSVPLNRNGGTPIGDPEAVYSYTDESGQELFQALRYKTERGKTFRQRHRSETGEWVGNMEDVRRVPYHLPRLIQAVENGDPIYIVEGEKDVEALEDRGKFSTCNPMGAGKWRPEFAPYFAGAKVVIWADRDEPGRNHADTVFNALEGVARSRIIILSRFGKDASDHLEQGGTLDMDPITGFKQQRVRRRGMVSTKQLAEHARERLTMNEDDLPAYVIAPDVTGLGEIRMRQGRMYAWGAYTGHGETSLALQGFRSLSSAGTRCGYWTLEMPEIDLMNRLVAHRGVPLEYTEYPWKFRGNPEMLDLYLDSVTEIESWNSDIIFESNTTAESIRQRTIDREYEAIFIDHIHRIPGKRDQLQDEVRAITNIALEHNVMVVVLCQLRKFERGNGRFVAYPKPTLQDFRETSQIGDDASMALAIWRQTDEAGMTYTGPTEVIMLKNRYTTGHKDAAGRFWTPKFDPTKQMFLPRETATPVMPIPGEF